MIKLGVHVSIAGTIDQAADNARELGCDTFQMFTRNPRGWKFKELAAEEIAEFRRKTGAYGLKPIISHMPYLPNLSSPKKRIYNKSVKSLSAELERCDQLGIPYIVAHLGSHLGKGTEIGLKNIVSAINLAISENNNEVVLLLENTAGTKNSMGSTYEEIKNIFDGLHDKKRAGICFDTAHAFAAGYDLRTAETVNSTFARFDEVLGLNLLKVIHLNDSLFELGAGKDRHEHIGMGHIGEAGFKAIFEHKVLRELPFIMETPIDDRRGDVESMRKVRELAA